MKIIEITVTDSRLYNIPKEKFANARPEATMTAIPDNGDTWSLSQARAVRREIAEALAEDLDNHKAKQIKQYLKRSGGNSFGIPSPSRGFHRGIGRRG